MTEPIEPLSPEIAALLARERDAYPADPPFADALLARVEMSIALAGGLGGGGAGGPGGAAGPAGAGAGAAKAGAAKAGAAAKVGGAAAATKALLATAAFVAGGAVGGALVATTRAPSHAERAPVASASAAPSAAPRAEPAPSARASSEPAEPAPPASASGAPAEGARPAPSARAASGDLTRERELVDVARAALARGRPNDAIDACERHARTWPRGALAEDRDAVWIQALAAAGRRADAEKRAASFRRAYPNSMDLPVIDEALRAGDR